MDGDPPYATGLILGLMLLVAWKVTGFLPTEASLSKVWFSQATLEAGEWHRLFTSVVAHGGPLHLAFNGIALVSLAGMETRLGTLRYASVFLAAAVAGTLAQVATSTTPVVGASGGVFGLLGVVMALAPGARLSFFGLPVPAAVLLPAYAAVVFLVPGLDQLAPIAHAAHLGGLGVGVLGGVALDPARSAPNLGYAALAFAGVGLLVVNVRAVGLATLADVVASEGLAGLLARAWPGLVGLTIVGVVLGILPDPEAEPGPEPASEPR